MNNEYFASINEVSRELGLPAHTLRYWEKQFPTIVRPVAGAGGRRYYRPETVARLKTIQDLLYNRGMTIAGVKKLIHNGEFSEIEIAPTVRQPSRPDDAPVRAPMVPAATYDDIFGGDAPRPVNTLDTTKVDLAIGLLTQARELLQ